MTIEMSDEIDVVTDTIDNLNFHYRVSVQIDVVDGDEVNQETGDINDNADAVVLVYTYADGEKYGFEVSIEPDKYDTHSQYAHEVEDLFDSMVYAILADVTSPTK